MLGTTWVTGWSGVRLTLLSKQGFFACGPHLFIESDWSTKEPSSELPLPILWSKVGDWIWDVDAGHLFSALPSSSIQPLLTDTELHLAKSFLFSLGNARVFAWVEEERGLPDAVFKLARGVRGLVENDIGCPHTEGILEWRSVTNEEATASASLSGYTNGEDFSTQVPG